MQDNFGASPVVENTSSNNYQSSPEPVSQPSQPAAPAEKLLPQDKVNHLVGNARQEGYSKAKAEYEAKLNSTQSQAPSAQTPVHDEETVRKFVTEELARREEQTRAQQVQEMQTREGQRILNELTVHIDNANAKYADFKEATKWMDLNDPLLGNVLVAIHNQENAPDLIYDLANNPEKVAILNNTPVSARPLLVRRWAESIKANNQAMSQKTASNPLQRISPSNVGLDNGNKESTPESERSKFKGMF